MKTGFGEGDSPHTDSMLYGAVAVFLTDLIGTVRTLQAITNETDVRRLMASCANRLLQTPKSQQLESLVDQVLRHPDGTPVAPGPLLDSVLRYYHHDRSSLVPAILESGAVALSSEEATALMADIDGAAPLVPATPFQRIVCGAIDNLYK